ncbi:MAG: ATP-binding protein [Deltaproteobacteria bacterium]|nr:ATP-binding protein [Deltaproteobacteria bacterium]
MAEKRRCLWQAHLHRRIFELELERVEQILRHTEREALLPALGAASESGALAFAVLAGEVVLFSDPRFTEALGQPRAALQGADLPRLVSLMDEDCTAALRRVASGEARRDHCLGIVAARPGSDRHYELRVQRVTGPGEGASFVFLALFELIGDEPEGEAEEPGSDAVLDPGRMLQLVLDSIPVRVFWKDLRGRYLGCNALFARDAGKLHPEEVVGVDDFSLGWRDQAELYRADDFAVMRGQVEKLGYEEPQTTPDGRTIWLRTSKRPLRGSEGEVIGVLGTYEDITLQKRLAEESLHKEKLEAIGRLAGGVAHDFNNMLTAILGSLDLLEMSLEASKDTTELLEAIREASSRATDLTRQLLTFARKQIIEPKPIDPNDHIRRIERLLRRLLGEQITLEASLEEGAWTILVDPGQFEQLLVNLAVNARDAMPAGGTLTFETHNVVLDRWGNGLRSAGPYLQIVVRDTGEGVDLDTQQHIFEPFYTTKGERGGTGLGLAMCHGIVSQSGGFIELESRPGAGTTFEIYLPRHRGKTDAEDSEGEVPLERRGKETLLVVEDEPAVRKVCVATLEGQGYRVLEAGSVAEGLRVSLAFAGPIDLLLSDVILPDGKGPQLARELQAARPEMKVLFTSGYTEEISASDGSLAAGLHFLQKPYRTQELCEALARLLDE